MVEEKNSIHISAAPEEVWDLMNDLSRKTEYVHFVSEVFGVSDNPVGSGTVYQERARFGPRESVSQWTFVEFDPPKRQVQKSESREMHARFTGELQPEGDGTRLSVEMRVHLLPVMRPAGWLLEKLVAQRKLKGDIAQTLSALKRLVEAERERD